MWLLNWLNARISDVLEWFGNNYAIWISRLKNYWSNLYNYAVTAYGWAKDYLLPKITDAYNDAVNWARNQINAVWSWLTELTNTIWNWIIDKYGQAKAYTLEQIDAFRTTVNNWVDAVYAWIAEKILELYAWIETIRQYIIDLFAPTLELFEPVAENTAFLSPDTKEKVLEFVNNGFSVLLGFWSNPLGFIISILKPIFIEFFVYSIAYGLGSVEAELPSFPLFGWGDTGNGGNGITLPNDVKMGMVAPLNYLYVSGYRFSSSHPGLDLGLQRGAPVFAMHAGVIEYVNPGWTGYGHHVTVRGDKLWTRYAHLISIDVSQGQQVTKGHMVGRGNSTGNSTGDHLHLEIKYNGSFVDPMTVLF